MEKQRDERERQREKQIAAHTNTQYHWLAGSHDRSGGSLDHVVAMETGIGAYPELLQSAEGERDALCRGVRRGRPKPRACCL